MSKFNVKARHQARRRVLQALYQWHISGENLNEIELQFRQEASFNTVDHEYFHELLHEIPAHLSTLEGIFTVELDRKLSDLDPIELTTLRMACYELSMRPEIPYRVVLNEALELTKEFGTDQGYRYVNGVLDKVAKRIRSLEANT